MKKRLYKEPLIEINYIATETGFLTSTDPDWGLPGENPTVNNYGDF